MELGSQRGRKFEENLNDASLMCRLFHVIFLENQFSVLSLFQSRDTYSRRSLFSVLKNLIVFFFFRTTAVQILV